MRLTRLWTSVTLACALLGVGATSQPARVRVLRAPTGIAFRRSARSTRAARSGSVVQRAQLRAATSGGLPTLSEGSTGSDVRWLQYILTRITLAENQIDGVFGPRTKNAVEEF